MQMRRMDRSFIVVHFEKFETKNVPELFTKVMLVSDIASNNIKLELQSNVSSREQSRENRQFFKRDMKFSMEAN